MKKFFSKLKKSLGKIGPGFITGAADDDPSGITTYSIAGAQYGYKLNWMTIFLHPAMVSIQEMCGRIGLVTGKGLSGIIKKYYSKRLLVFATTLLAIANVINIGANLGIMAASMQMLFGFYFKYWLVVVGLFIIWMELVVPYKQYSKFLKWLALSLMVYVVTAFMVKQDWKEIAFNTLIPQIEFNLDYLMMMIAFLGTTISPYLFFWQTSEEVEEKIAEGEIRDFNCKPEVKTKDIKIMGMDTKIGMFFSNLMAFFIIITTAATLHVNGITNIETPQQAAMALRPLAGNFAYILFSVGIIGIGCQSIPVLAGSLGYAVSEMIGVKEGLSKKIKQARVFYLVIAMATVIGVLINIAGINVMKALYYAAIVNGIAAVPLIAIIIKIASNKEIMGKNGTKRKNRIIAWIVFLFMLISVLIMFWQVFLKDLFFIKTGTI